MTPPDVVPLHDQALPAAAAALARAFHDDPLQVHCLPDPATGARRSPAHFELVLPSAIGDEAAERFLGALAALEPYHPTFRRPTGT